jgi:hypothetical protein
MQPILISVVCLIATGRSPSRVYLDRMLDLVITSLWRGSPEFQGQCQGAVGYGAQCASPSNGDVQPKRSGPIPLGYTPRHPSNQIPFRKGQIVRRLRLPDNCNGAWSEHVKDFSQDDKPVSVSTPPVIVFKAPFSGSSHALHKKDLLNLARND